MARSTCISAEAREPMEVEAMEGLMPFVRELLSQRPSRGLLKVYLVGSVFALLGTVIGLVKTVCHPFSSGDTLDSDVALTLARTPSTQQQNPVAKREDVDAEEKKVLKEKLAELTGGASLNTTFSKRPTSQRSTANRLHAS